MAVNDEWGHSAESFYHLTETKRDMAREGRATKTEDREGREEWVEDKGQQKGKG